MRKIVIIPSFASAHFLKCWIPNVIESIEPDIIIINEGLFPQGPENKGHIDDEFRKKWCHNQIEFIGFDYDESREFCKKYTNVFLFKVKHAHNDTNLAFLDSVSRGLHTFSIKTGDIIFPLEPDAFHHQKDKDVIAAAVKSLKPGEGIQTKWVDFLETQYYTEAINLVHPKYRRFAYCFDNMENYKKAMSGFMSQDYPRLKKVEDFITYHYCWFQPEPYKQLRYDLIYRKDPQYWKDFDRGLQEIRSKSEELVKRIKSNLFAAEIIGTKSLTLTDNNLFYDMNILIRPSRHDEGRWAKFIDVDHPKAIHNHPNFIK